MTLQIRDIRTVKPTPGRLYFLDANVWLHVLATSPPARAQPYTYFFQQLLEVSDGTSIIAATSLLIAETFNAHLKVGFKLFSQQHAKPGSRPLTFKEDYRPTQDYKNQRDSFLYGFGGYSSFVQIVPDDVEQTDIWQMLERIPAHADFNDFYYARFCRNQGYAIVTDDGDFKFEDVPILTANTNLLALRTN